MRNLHTIRIKNGRIWDGETFFDGDVLIQDGVIAELGKSSAAPAEFEFDAAGRTVTPGLADAHVHIRGLSVDTYGTPIEPVCFANGVTAAADGGAEQGDGALADALMVQTVVFVPVHIRNNRADFDGVDAALRRYGSRAVGLKLYFDVGTEQVRDTRPLKEICAFARERNRKVMVHSTGTPVPMCELLDCMSAGDILTHAYHGGANNAAEDGFASLLAAQKRGVVIDVGMAGAVHTDFSVFRSAIAQGALPDVISTDITKLSAFVRGGNYGLNLCMTVARALGMPEDAVLRAVTSAPARALGKEDVWGRLEPGRRADLAVLEWGSALYDFRNTRWGSGVSGTEGYRCLLTVADGQTVYRNGI